MDRETRRRVLLSAVLAYMASKEQGEADVRLWGRAGRAHLRSWSWSQRKPGFAWRAGGRLRQTAQSDTDTW